jgi:hypothetical protein
MASWRDGPEYAPVERPVAFAAPRAPDLPVAEPRQSLANGAPVQRPDEFHQPSVPVPALASLAPRIEPTRDAHQPFEVASMTLTRESSAWSSAHSSVLQPHGADAAAGFDPMRPILTSAPQPGSSEFAPPSGAPVQAGGFAPPAPYQTAGRQVNVWQDLTPSVVVLLGLGCLIPPVSAIMYTLAFVFSGRVVFARRAVRLTFSIGSSLLGLIALVTLFTGQDGFGGWWMGLGWWSLLACWITLPLCALWVYRDTGDGSGSRGPF